MTDFAQPAPGQYGSKSENQMSRVILLEFNELSPQLLSEFMAQGHLPNFTRLYQSSQVFTTMAEEEQEHLEPWIQWVTAHCGQSYSEHGIFLLGDGHKLAAPNVWDVASKAGQRVWICGSMNTAFTEPLNGAFIPDPWSNNAPPYPPGAYDAYYNFIRKNVQEYTRDKLQLSASDYIKFLRFMATNGLRASTVWEALKQLSNEWADTRRRWRRVALLDKLQWDLFEEQYKKLLPHLSTFFINSTAHLQHMYWRNMEPSLFLVRPTPREQTEYAHAILFGYQKMDRLVGRALALRQFPAATVVLASALSQQPCLKYEEFGGKVYYRPINISKLLDFSGVDNACDVAPVMSEQFHLHFETRRAAEEAHEKLAQLTLNGERLLSVFSNENSLFCGCQIFKAIDQGATVRTETSARFFFDLFYLVEGVKSGMHHPSGVLWISRPGDHHCEYGVVPLKRLAPTILSMLGVDKPPTMSEESLTLPRPAQGARAS